MSDPGVVEHRPSGLARYAPGLAQLRRYDRSWLRADLVAGLVLAAILVPQGMAYAQLAGLPAVTGLYTTVACLVGYAVFGPSRLLVLGPDSSVSPLIFAAIVPILGASKDPADAIALAGMLALLVGAIEIGLGVAKLGFVADLLSKEVQVGYMNGLAIVIVVGQLPKLCGFSTDADTFVTEITSFVQHLDQTNPVTLAVGLGTLAVLLVLPRFSRKLPAILIGDRRRDHRLRRPRPLRARGQDGRCAAAGAAQAEHPLDPGERCRAAPGRGPGHHDGVADRHDRHVDELLGPPRGGGQPRPGDDRPGGGQRGGRGVPGVRGVDERVAHRGGRAVGGEEPGDRAGGRRDGGPAAAVPELAAGRPAPDRPRGRGHHRRVLADGPPRRSPLRAGPPHRPDGLPRGDRRRRLPRRAAGHPRRHRAVDPHLLPQDLVRRTARCSGGSRAVVGTAWPPGTAPRRCPASWSSAGKRP